MGQASFINRGLRRLEAYQSNSLGVSPKFQWDGSWYPCVTSTIRRGDVISYGGRDIQIETSIIVRKGLFPKGITVDSTLIFADNDIITADSDIASQPPSIGKRVDHRGRALRVVSIRESPFDASITLDLVHPEA